MSGLLRFRRPLGAAGSYTLAALPPIGLRFAQRARCRGRASTNLHTTSGRGHVRHRVQQVRVSGGGAANPEERLALQRADSSHDVATLVGSRWKGLPCRNGFLAWHIAILKRDARMSAATTPSTATRSSRAVVRAEPRERQNNGDEILSVASDG